MISGRAELCSRVAHLDGFTRRMISLPRPSTHCHAAEVREYIWFVSHAGKFSKNVNAGVRHCKECIKKEGTNEKMSTWCSTHSPKGAYLPWGTKEEHKGKKKVKGDLKWEPL